MTYSPRMSQRPFPKRIRLEASHYLDPDCRFHVVVRAFPNTRPFAGDLGELVWENLLAECDRAGVTIVAACLMPDHLHLLAGPNSQPLDRWVGAFKSYTSKMVRASGYSRPVWQRGLYDHLVRDEAEYAAVLQYIRQNPVEAGYVDDSNGWPWLLLPGE